LEEEFVLKVRIKFAKQGQMKFIGHLDIMRYFQKAIKRAKIDILYSEGFSPHQKMSFASPLGVGILSKGEYFDIEVDKTTSSVESLNALNEAMVYGMEVLSYRRLPDDAKNCMSIIEAADYLVHFPNEPGFTDSQIEDFISREEIVILKKTKKSEKEINIKPLIYDIKNTDEGLFMKVASGSADNLKPETVISALSEQYNVEIKGIVYERLEMYAKDKDGEFLTLESFGEIIE